MQVFFTTVNAKMKKLAEDLEKAGKAVPKSIKEFVSNPRPLDKSEPPAEPQTV